MGRPWSCMSRPSVSCLTRTIQLYRQQRYSCIAILRRVATDTMSSMTASPQPAPQGPDQLSTVERIRRAALASFAVHGTAATTLRAVATAAGVSLGLVQHHFATKSGLIKAVDDHVLALLIEELSQPIPEPPADSVADIGSRLTRHHRRAARRGGLRRPRARRWQPAGGDALRRPDGRGHGAVAASARNAERRVPTST